MDTAGPFGKSVKDVAYLLDVLLPGRSFLDTLHQSDESGSGPVKIGVSNERFEEITPEDQDMFSHAQRLLGHMVVEEDVRVELHKEVKESGGGFVAGVTLQSGLAPALEAYLDDTEGPMRTLQDIVNWHDQHPVCPSPISKPSHDHAPSHVHNYVST